MIKKVLALLMLSVTALVIACSPMQKDLAAKIVLGEALMRAGYASEIHEATDRLLALDVNETYDIYTLAEETNAIIEDVFLTPSGRAYAKEFVAVTAKDILEKIGEKGAATQSAQLAIALDYIRFINDATAPIPGM